MCEFKCQDDVIEALQPFSPQENKMTKQYWQKRYDINFDSWTEPEGNLRMQNVLKRMLEKDLAGKGAADIKVLVPLCGKTGDLYQLYSKGFTVVGIDWVRTAIDSFMTDYNIDVDPNSPSPYVKSKDGRLMFGHGDLFSFGADDTFKHKLPFDKFDIIWDRGCFDSINIEDKERFAQKMTSLLAPGGVYILDVKRYDAKGYVGPPLPTEQKDVEQFYADKLKVELGERGDWLSICTPAACNHWKSRDINELEQSVYILKHKQ